MTLLFPVALAVVFLLQLHGYSILRRFIDLVVTTQREVDDTLSHQSQIYTHVTAPGPQDP